MPLDADTLASSPEDDKSSTSSLKAFNDTHDALFIPFPGISNTFSLVNSLIYSRLNYSKTTKHNLCPRISWRKFYTIGLFYKRYFWGYARVSRSRSSIEEKWTVEFSILKDRRDSCRWFLRRNGKTRHWEGSASRQYCRSLQLCWNIQCFSCCEHECGLEDWY